MSPAARVKPRVKAATVFPATGTSYIKLFVLEVLAPPTRTQTRASLLVDVTFVIVNVETTAWVSAGTV
jgi:hypothetical protein